RDDLAPGGEAPVVEAGLRPPAAGPFALPCGAPRVGASREAADARDPAPRQIEDLERRFDAHWGAKPKRDQRAGRVRMDLELEPNGPGSGRRDARGWTGIEQ